VIGSGFLLIQRNVAITRRFRSAADRNNVVADARGDVTRNVPESRDLFEDRSWMPLTIASMSSGFPPTHSVGVSPVQGYLAHKKLRPPRTLQWAYA